MSKEILIGMIGLDTSHVTAFTKLLNDKNDPFYVSGGKVIVAYPGGSPDFDLSISRVEGFTTDLRDNYHIEIVDTIEEVAEKSDAILLESVDGRVHLEQFKKIVGYGKPVFIDKPFAVSSADAEQIAALAKEHNVPIMSASSLRYAEALKEALSDDSLGAVIGADFYGPMAIQPTQPGLYWYGIHTVDMLFASLGKGCVHVNTYTTEDHDVVVGQWEDGRLGTIRGNRSNNNKFGGVVHREQGSQFIDVYANPKPYYASLLEEIMIMFETGKSNLDLSETVELIRFIEAANDSRDSGKQVKL